MCLPPNTKRDLTLLRDLTLMGTLRYTYVPIGGPLFLFDAESNRLPYPTTIRARIVLDFGRERYRNSPLSLSLYLYLKLKSDSSDLCVARSPICVYFVGETACPYVGEVALSTIPYFENGTQGNYAV